MCLRRRRWLNLFCSRGDSLVRNESYYYLFLPVSSIWHPLIFWLYLLTYTCYYVHNSSYSILGKEHFYVLDGFTLVNGREVHDINFIPTTYYEPIIPQVPGHSIYIRTVSPKLFGKNKNKLTQRDLSPCYSLIPLVYAIPCWLVWGTNWVHVAMPAQASLDHVKHS